MHYINYNVLKQLTNVQLCVKREHEVNLPATENNVWIRQGKKQNLKNNILLLIYNNI